MKRYSALLVVTALFVGAATLPAQEGITIKLKERGEGEAALIKKKETTNTKVKVTDGKGNVVVDRTETKTELQEYTETILKRQDGKLPTKLERAYSKAQTTQDDKTSDGPLHGKTVLIEKKGEKYTFTYKDGTEVTDKALEALARSFEKKSEESAEIEKMVLPKGPVKVGQSWKIDMPKIVAEFAKQGEMALDADKATGNGTLVKAYKKNGQQYGEMKFKMEMPVMSIGKGNQQLKFMAGAKIAMDLTLDGCIDGTADAGLMKMKMIITGTADGGAGALVMLNLNVDATQSQEETAKKK
jgi:hypothetical protein